MKSFNKQETGNRKVEIERSFSRAAETYDDFAMVQMETAASLAGKMPGVLPAGAILEIGCGTGTLTQLLAAKYPESSILAVDFSAKMLEMAMRKKIRAGIRFHCEDAETMLGSIEENFAAVVSNATFQWFGDIRAAFVNIRRILNPEGVFTGSMFGPKSLEEVASALSSVLEREASLPAGLFPGRSDIERILLDVFPEVAFEEIKRTTSYNSFQDLLNHIRRTGTAGWRGYPPPVFTRKRLAAIDRWFQEKHGGFSITYQIFEFNCKL